MNGLVHRFGPEVLRTLFIASVTSGTTMYSTVQTMNVELHATQMELRSTKELVTEMRLDLKLVSRLAIERGAQLEELFRKSLDTDARLRALENRSRR